MSDQPPATPPDRNLVAFFLLWLGIILLLPGLCSLVSLFSGIWPSGVDQVAIAEVIGLLLSALGVGLIAFAIRRLRRS